MNAEIDGPLLYVINFGHGNEFWPIAREQNLLLTYNEEQAHHLIEAGDLEGAKRRYLEVMDFPEIRERRQANPSLGVAATWVTYSNIVRRSVGDIFIHLDGDRIWWCVPDEGVVDLGRKKVSGYSHWEQMVGRPLAEGWTNQNRNGVRLAVSRVHPMARGSIFLQGMMRPIKENRDYFLALIDGEDLSDWEEQVFSSQDPKKTRIIKAAPHWGACYDRMADNAIAAMRKSGQLVTTRVKDKEGGMLRTELYLLAKRLTEAQDYRCAITGYRLVAEDDEDADLRPSLDRIDSDKKYEKGNLQVVARFINDMKSSTPMSIFIRRLQLVRSAPAISMDGNSVSSDELRS